MKFILVMFSDLFQLMSLEGYVTMRYFLSLLYYYNIFSFIIFKNIIL